ncbi:sugar ABC transporter ATP-binding protein [Siculibacillus lacustris]|uniref:Sugar ABC transporter ATP-binding protein n=1 Tax=Siculibacillus lacustris TaxID=1549641 RepID=A0A4Q9VRG1_9HYPH|nr:sugar ABC transporter ATP-binding protein [Siculibacillus lacustris]TBW37627.1 sugar ABC transporter ATP-binding protein [Siculibacillus lacustris]
MPDVPAPFIVLDHLVKTFAGVKALTDVGFSIAPGEVVCLAGENGSGKSTLIKILAGAQAPDDGTITIDGRVHHRLGPRAAVAAGIQVIFQDFSLFPNLTVAENIAFSTSLAAGSRWVRRGRMREIAAAALARVGVTIDLDTPVEKLAVADKQLVAISRALVSDARLIIMDEPTSALTEREVRALIAIIRRLKGDGVAVLFVSHKLAEIFEVCEKIVVLRNGRKVIEAPAAEFDPATLAFHMTGRRFEPAPPTPGSTDAPPILEAAHLTRAGQLDDVGFTLHAGEVLGITGLLGSGRTQLAKALFGLTPIDSGTIRICGRDIAIRSPRAAIAAGIGYVPEDRLTEGLFLAQSIGRNIAVGRLDAHAGFAGILDRPAYATEIDQWLERLRIAAPDAATPVQSLSGGNQQRVVLARWLATNPKILILNGPTVGVDVGSKSDIHAIVAGLAAAGMGLIVISDDVPEILAVSHRILVMKAGRIVDTFAGGAIGEADLARRLAS